MANTFLHLRSVAGALAVAAVLAWNPAHAAAAQRLDTASVAEPLGVSLRAVDLEEIFWACDHAATAGLVEANERAICAVVTEELKAERFGGDFERMLDWWRANRTLEHRRLDGMPGAIR